MTGETQPMTGDGERSRAQQAAEPTPELVRITRGAQVESVHRGAIAVVGPGGVELASVGDVARAVFPRSAIKLLQALPFVTSGAADRHGFTEAELALAIASHSGEPMHAERVSATLARLGKSASDLACGAHWPIGIEGTKALVRAGREPGRVHNNCSGKHTMMIAAAAEVSVAGYARVDHPVQREVRNTIARVCDIDLSDAHAAVDGCGAPNWPIPVISLARGFQRLAAGEGGGLPAGDAAAAQRLMAAAWANPLLTSGTGRLDADVLARAAGRVYLKTGAEGVYCAALPHLGIGLALKIADGATRAAEFTVLTLLAAIYDDLSGLRAERGAVNNWAGERVGRLLPSELLAECSASLSKAIRV